MTSNKKEQQVINDWKAYNKSTKDKRLFMSFEDYKNWINGTTKKIKPSFSKEPILSIPLWANNNSHIKSVISNTHQSIKPSMVERVRLGLEIGTTAEEIIRKSKRIGLSYSKGCYQYISEDTDLKELGRKNPIMK